MATLILLEENKLKKILCASLIALACTSSYAGVNGVTHHSRANCGGFNESVSWDLTGYHYFWVNSNHYDQRGNLQCQMVSGWEDTWRNAQYHPRDSFSGWHVDGFHWMPDPTGAPKLVAQETVTDCSIYDGWWNY